MPRLERPRFETRCAVHVSGHLSVIENRYNDATYPRHAHAESIVTIILAGHLRERVGRVEETPRAFSVVVKPRDTEHANEFQAGVRALQIRLSESAAASAEPWSETLRHWRWSQAGPALPSFIDLLKLCRACAAGMVGSNRVELAVYDTLAALTLPRAATLDAPRWLRIARESLDDVGAPRSVGALAANAGVHPVYLARQFRHWFGCSITEYLRRRRVGRAATAIASTSASLSFIAQQSGFADQPHLSRHFVRESGATPAAFRRLVSDEV